MRDKSTLPFLSEGMNSYRKPSTPVTILDSIPENEDGSSNESLKVHQKEESKRDEAKKRWHKLSTAVNLPKLDNKSGTASSLDRGICSPNASSYLNIANMRLSPRENNEKLKRENDIKCANYLLFEPAIADQVSADIDLSRYAFRSTLERIPETDGERLQSAHSKRKSNSAEKEKRNSTTTEKKKKKVRSLKSLDLFDQQQQQLAREGPPIRVWFSYKQQNTRPVTPDRLTTRLQDPTDKPQKLTGEHILPRIILYQWEVHKEQPKLIPTLGPKKQQKGLPKVHRIPTAPQAIQHSEKDGDSIDDNVRSDSPLSKTPKAPPPTPRCHRCPSSSSGNVPS
ncbi:uncharacterized protein LOC144651275 [Oculina patagonica]